MPWTWSNYSLCLYYHYYYLRASRLWQTYHTGLWFSCCALALHLHPCPTRPLRPGLSGRCRLQYGSLLVSSISPIVFFAVASAVKSVPDCQCSSIYSSQSFASFSFTFAFVESAHAIKSWQLRYIRDIPSWVSSYSSSKKASKVTREKHQIRIFLCPNQIIPASSS